MRSALGTSLQRLLDNHRRVQRGGDDDAVRKLRVAMRRIRYDLVTFGKIIDADASRALRRPLRDLGTPLGELRNCEVLVQRLSERLAGEDPNPDTAGQRLLATAREQHATAREIAFAAMAEPLFDETVMAVATMVEAPPLRVAALTPVAPLLREAIRGSWRDLRDQVRRAHRKKTDEELHATRIAAKRTRYAAESVAPVLGPHAAEFAIRLAALQSVLGRHQDGIVTAQWLEAMVDTDPSLAIMGSGLAALERREAAVAEAEWPPAWAEIRALPPGVLWAEPASDRKEPVADDLASPDDAP